QPFIVEFGHTVSFLHTPSSFIVVQPVALDAIKGLTQEFHKDPHPNKILLGEGVYRDNEGKPVVLPSVRNAEKIIFEANLDHEYAPVSGIPAFCQVARAFAFGSDSSAVRDQKVILIIIEYLLCNRLQQFKPFLVQV